MLTIVVLSMVNVVLDLQASQISSVFGKPR